MSLAEFCKISPITISQESTVQEAALLMNQLSVGVLVVSSLIEGRVRPVGILTDRDIVIRSVAKNLHSDSTLISSVMTKEIVQIDVRSSVNEALNLMQEHQVRRLLIADANQDLIGLLSIDDFIQSLGVTMQAVSNLYFRQNGTQQRHVVHDFTRMA